MAKMTTTRRFTESIEDLLTFTEAEAFEALEAGIVPVIDSIKNKGKELGVYDTGQTINSLRPGKPKYDNKRGTYRIRGEFHGNRKARRGSKKTRNSSVAFINEFGVEMKAARPFVAEGNADAADEAAKVVADKLYGGKK